MKKFLIYLMMATAAVTFGACSSDDGDDSETPEISDNGGKGTPENPGDDPGIPGGGGKILVAYFSWGGTTQRMAQEIVRQTGADIFRIEPVVPYPTEYTPCTEVALEEKNNNARPAIAGTVENWADYGTVFIGCPVWWWTTPMIICTFAESYDFRGKTVVPFCTYASTYRDETLARIVELTARCRASERRRADGRTNQRANHRNVAA